MDRFEKMVERENFANGCSCGNCKDARTLAVKIIRRQHAAMVRMVKRKRCIYWKFGRSGVQEGQLQACDSVLAALTQYKKGTS